MDLEKLINNILQWCDTIEQAFFRICNLLSHCNKAGMVFSPLKFAFAKEEVEFAGLVISNVGIKTTQKYMQAIQTFPTPRNIHNVQSLFSLINQVAYCFARSKVMEPFSHLLIPKSEWDKEMENAFIASKEIMKLIRNGVFSFDPGLITCLSPDYSNAGMGWILQQKTCKCADVTPMCCKTGWRLVLAGGKFCNSAETRYSPTKEEATTCVEGLRDTK